MPNLFEVVASNTWRLRREPRGQYLACPPTCLCLLHNRTLLYQPGNSLGLQAFRVAKKEEIAEEVGWRFRFTTYSQLLSHADASESASNVRGAIMYKVWQPSLQSRNAQSPPGNPPRRIWVLPGTSDAQPSDLRLQQPENLFPKVEQFVKAQQSIKLEIAYPSSLDMPDLHQVPPPSRW